MDLDDETAAQVLQDGASGPNGRQVYGFHDGRVYEFQPDGVGGYHGYPLIGDVAPHAILREFLRRGIITRAQYKRLTKGD